MNPRSILWIWECSWLRKENEPKQTTSKLRWPTEPCIRSCHIILKHKQIPINDIPQSNVLCIFCNHIKPSQSFPPPAVLDVPVIHLVHCSDNHLATHSLVGQQIWQWTSASLMVQSRNHSSHQSLQMLLHPTLTGCKHICSNLWVCTSNLLLHWKQNLVMWHCFEFKNIIEITSSGAVSMHDPRMLVTRFNITCSWSLDMNTTAQVDNIVIQFFQCDCSLPPEI